MLLIWNNPGASLACQGFAYCFRHSNKRGTTTLFEIIDDGTDFGAHTAFREVSLVVITFGLAQRDGIQVTLLRFFKMKRGFLYGSRNEQEICMKLASKQT